MAGITEIGVRISLEGAQQTQQGLQQTAQGAERLSQSLGKLGTGQAGQAAQQLNLVGISAGQATAAMRQLPAQITDIVTGLASGQAPLQVLIQQGGQLRDSFGSVGNVFKALASVVTPTSVAIGAAAAAIGGLIVGIRGGQAEFDAYNRAITLTGNAAGTTAGQLSDLAAAVGRTVGGQGKAADALAQLAATGAQLGVGLDKAAEAAVRLERVGGPAVAQTVKAFADLAKDPLQASIRLNEATNFLTRSTYEQIRALSEQGKTAAAAALASAEFYRVSVERSTQLEGQLGSIERGWLAIKGAINGAKNALLSIGRPDTAQTRIEDLEGNIARIYRLREDPSYKPDAASNRNLARLEAELDGLLRLRDAEAKLGAQQALNVQQTKDAIGASKARSEADREAAAEARKTAALLAELNGLNADYADDLQRLQRLRAAGTLTEERYVAAVTALIQKQPFARQLAQQTAQAERERAQALERSERAYQSYLNAIDRDIAGADKQVDALEEQIALITGGEAARERLIQQRLDDAAAQARQTAEAALWSEGQTAEVAKLQQLADRLEQVAAKRRELAGAAAQKEAADANAKAAAEAAREWQSTADDIRGALTDAFRRAFESGESFGKAFGAVIEREIKARLASALAGLVTNGIIQIVGGVLTGQSAGGGGTNWLQTASTAQSAYNLYNGGGLYGQAGRMALNTSLGSSIWYGSGAGLAQGGGAAASIGGSSAGAVLGDASGVAVANASGSGSLGASASWGTWAAWAALIYAGVVKANSDWNEGFRRDQARDVSQEIPLGRLLGDVALFGGIEATKANFLSQLGFSDKLADLFSGSTAIAKTFGRAAPRLEAQGVSGTISGGDFSGQSFFDIVEKGGIFRSDKRYTQFAELPDELGRLLDQGARQVFDQASKFGDALGLPAERLSQVTSDLRIEFAKPENDTKEAIAEAARKNLEAIADALGEYGDDLVNAWADAVKPLAEYGESAAQTIQRVGASLLGVNDVLEALGLTALQASVDGGRAALALEQLFGGIDNLRGAGGSFLQNYFSDDERRNLTLQGIGDVLGDLGLSVPATRDAFRDLVEAQDLTTDSGRKAFAALMGVADAFAAVVPAAEDAGAALAAAAQRIAGERQDLQLQLWRLQGNDKAIRDYERSLIAPENLDLYDQIQTATTDKETAEAAAEADRQRAAAAYEYVQASLQAEAAAIEAARVAAQAWTEIGRTLEQEINRLRGVVTGGQQDPSALAAQFATATAQARAGDQEAARRLPELSKALSEAFTQQAGSRRDLELFNARLAASLERTLLATGGRMSGDAPAGNGNDLLFALAELARQQKRAADILEGFDIDGMPGVRP